MDAREVLELGELLLDDVEPPCADQPVDALPLEDELGEPDPDAVTWGAGSDCERALVAERVAEVTAD